VGISDANWQIFWPQNTYVAAFNCQRPAVLPTGRNFGRKTQKWPPKNISGRDNHGRFSKEWLKSGRTFLKFVIHIKNFIISRNIRFNTLMNATFCMAEASVKQPLIKDNMCGRIFFASGRIYFGTSFGQK
jgi:hypothetical protein